MNQFFSLKPSLTKTNSRAITKVLRRMHEVSILPMVLRGRKEPNLLLSVDALPSVDDIKFSANQSLRCDDQSSSSSSTKGRRGANKYEVPAGLTLEAQLATIRARK